MNHEIYGDNIRDEKWFLLEADWKRTLDYWTDVFLCVDTVRKKIYMNVNLADVWPTVYKKELSEYWEMLDIMRLEEVLIEKAKAFYEFKKALE